MIRSGMYRPGARRSQRGDTLVEVLISILVVSLILTGAYVATNQSTVGIRNSQEHAEALKLAQGQLEQLRANSSSSQTIFAQAAGSPFCMVNGNAVLVSSQSDGAKCKVDRSGAPTTDQPAYEMSIVRRSCAITAGCNEFTIKASWDSVTGSGRANEQMVYRLYK